MADPIDQGAFRGALSRFASGITVVSTVTEGIDHAMTVSAFSSVSLDPPLVLVGLDKKARMREAVLSAEHWGVSVLSEAGRKASAWLATKGRPLESQLDDVAHHRGVTGVALMDEALAWLECRHHDVIDSGDHTLLIGRVVAAQVREDVDATLLYYRGHYGSIVQSDESEKTLIDPADYPELGVWPF
jgi:flavin reductase